MNLITRCLALAAIVLVSALQGEEPLNIAGSYQRIVADYQRISATGDAGAQLAAGRLARDAYRLLLEQAKPIAKPTSDDQFALAACHEGLGDSPKATELYMASLKASPQARTHLALARLSLENDPAAAEQHFAQAVALQADHPDLPQFRLALAAARESKREWKAAIPHLESLLGYTKTLAERTPASSRLQLSHGAIQKRLDRVRRYAGMTGQPAPPLKVQYWAQGTAAEIAALKGKAVLIDFCAMWAEPSRARMEQLKELHKKYAAKGLEIVSVTLPYQHKYDEAADKVTFDKDLKLEDEKVGLAAFAKKHSIPWRLGLIGKETTGEYGVETLPQTVALDKRGNVSAIVFGGDQAQADLDTVVAKLLQ